jgi:NitT/TauT family transport system permease protein
MIGEWMGVWRGLGSVIVQAMFNMRGDQLWAAMVVATLLSVAAYVLVTLVERVAIPWHASVRRAKAGEE